MERASRKICVEMGSIASTSKAPRTGREVKDWGIHFTTTRRSGSAGWCAKPTACTTDPIAALLESEGGKRLFTGKVVDVARRTTEGFLRGSVAIEGIDDDRGSRLELSFQNEWIVAWREGKAVAMSPDLICVLEASRAMRSAPRRSATASVSPWWRCPLPPVPDQPARPRIRRPPRLWLRPGFPFRFRRAHWRWSVN